eukprot:gene10278-18975_t
MDSRLLSPCKANRGKTPCTARLLKLKEAGIGKRSVRFDGKNASHGKARKVPETVFPNLKSQAGAFEMLRAERGGTNCDLSPIPMSLWLQFATFERQYWRKYHNLCKTHAVKPITVESDHSNR